MISINEAKSFVLDGLVALETVQVDLTDALNCAVAGDVIAVEQVPSFTNSSMDGFALRAADSSSNGVRLRIVDSVLAGQVSSLRLGAAEAMRIMTGAPLPEGADTVCKIEDVTVEGQFVEVPRRLEEGEFVRRPGSDVQIGQLLLCARSEITAVAAAVAAGQGLETLHVHRRPVVGVMSTGDELATTHQALAPGQIRDLNRPLLLGLLRSSGFVGVDLGVAPDRHDEIARRVGDAAHHFDAVITTGGVSVGDVDHVKNVIGELAPEHSRSMQVAIKPAKPFAYGRVGGTPVFGLPGNPVSTRVSFELFVRPALRTLGGHRVIERLGLVGLLDVDLPTPYDDKTHLVHVRARLKDDGRVHVVGSAQHNSHLMSAITDCNALTLLVPRGSYTVGESVQLMILEADTMGPT